MKKTSADEIAGVLQIKKSRSLEATMKASIIAAILKQVETLGMTHADLAQSSGLPRSAVTGILSGSLQKVTLDRVLRLVDAAGLTAEVKIKKIA